MQILVTGASGFVGTNLVHRLIEEGHRVTALIRTRSHSYRLPDRGVDLIYGDLSDIQSLKAAVEGKDIIFNLAAALPHHRLKDEQYWETNVEGVKNLLEACKKADVERVVHVSTVGVYGSSPKIGTDEKTTFNPYDVYSKTKAEGEKIALDYWRKKKLPVTILRPTIGYGPGDTRPVFLPLFSLIKRKMFVSVGKGDNFLHTVYVDNLVDALLLAASSQEAIGEDFIIGDAECPTMKEIINTIAKIEGVGLYPFYIPGSLARVIGKSFDLLQKLRLPAPLPTQRVRFMVANRKFKIEKARKILGYRPRVNILEGMTATYKWYLENGLL